MGQKIHPTGFRLSVLRNWSSRWYANSKYFPEMLNEDIKVREFLRNKLSHAAVGKVVIERPAKNARITVYSARPGVVIGKKGEDIESLKIELQKLMNIPVHVNIEEIRKPELDAQLIAESIAQQLQKRIMFRRAMKRAITNAMRLGAQGIKIASSGRLNGIEIARSEWYREGRVPLHTLRADIDYGFAEAKTTYGVIGIKVWVFKGELMGQTEQPQAAPAVEMEKKIKPQPQRSEIEAKHEAPRELEQKPRLKPSEPKAGQAESPRTKAKPKREAEAKRKVTVEVKTKSKSRSTAKAKAATVAIETKPKAARGGSKAKK
ncbi:MAG TPA: 30S ribosomal protein S3 [Burkholderiales bacterium]|nr:30S ribosomal protein S3 [Burkholderiales bacterium]